MLSCLPSMSPRKENQMPQKQVDALKKFAGDGGEVLGRGDSQGSVEVSLDGEPPMVGELSFEDISREGGYEAKVSYQGHAVKAMPLTWPQGAEKQSARTRSVIIERKEEDYHLEEFVGVIEGGVQMLQKDMEAFARSMSPSPPMRSLSSQVEGQIVLLQKMMQALKVKGFHSPQLENQIALLRKDHQVALRHLELERQDQAGSHQAKDLRSSQLEGQIILIRLNNEKLTMERAELRAAYQQQAESLEAKETRSSQLESQITRLQKKNEELLQEQDACVYQFENQIGLLRKENVALTEERAELLATSQHQAELLEVNDSRFLQFERIITRLQKKNEELTGQKAELLQDKDARVCQLESQIGLLRKDNEALTKERAELQASSQHQAESLEVKDSRFSQLESHMTRLEKVQKSAELQAASLQQSESREAKDSRFCAAPSPRQGWALPGPLPSPPGQHSAISPPSGRVTSPVSWGCPRVQHARPVVFKADVNIPARTSSQPMLSPHLKARCFSMPKGDTVYAGA